MADRPRAGGGFARGDAGVRLIARPVAATRHAVGHALKPLLRHPHAIRAAPGPRGGREAPAAWGRVGRCPGQSSGRDGSTCAALPSAS
jgi:hypothetical protein